MKMQVHAELPGTVSFHHVKEGAMVQKDQHIADIECMKMNIPVNAPCSGRVHFTVSLGEMIAQEDVIAVIDG